MVTSQRELIEQAPTWATQALLDLLTASGAPASPSAQEVTLAKLLEGMVLAADVWAKDGNLLCGAGTKVIERLLERLHNWAERTGVDKPLFVEAKPAGEPAGGAVGSDPTRAR